MKVYILQDIEKVGMAGQVIKVADGYAKNYLIPKKLAIRVTDKEAVVFEKKAAKNRVQKEVLNSKVAMLGEHIRNLKLTLKKRVHDSGKLYGSVSADEVVQLLKENGQAVTKKQIEFDKSIKVTGEHKVTIKLSSKIKPSFTLKVVGVKEKQ